MTTIASQLTDRDLLHLFTVWLLQALDAGDDWQWTGVCDSPERARFTAWRGMTGHEQTREAA